MDDINALYGTYTYGLETFQIEEGEEDIPNVYLNNAKVEEVSFVLSDKRKSITFQKDDKTYIISPDQSGSSILLRKDGKVFYPINENLYSSYYKNTFRYQNRGVSFALSVEDDLSYQIGEGKGNATYSYTHGDKYPSLLVKYQGKDALLSLVQSDIGYYTLTTEGNIYDLYSKTALDKVYDTYSKDGSSDFSVTEEKLVKDGKDHIYSFTPVLQPKNGLYLFGITLDDGTVYQNNLHGCFYNDKESYIRKSLFSSLYGTYSGYGKYGIENIKFKEDGKLYLDSLNQDGTGLVRDVNYTYSILTNQSDEIAIYFNYSPSLQVQLLFEEDAVKITDLSYYREELVASWGTYVDGDDVVFFQDDKVYLNGTLLSFLKKEIKDGKLSWKTSDSTYLFDGKGNLSVKKDDTTKTFTRKFTFQDYEKFYGTYTINNQSVVFKKSSLNDSFEVSGTSYSYYITKHNGKYALTSSVFGSTYYLMLDETSGEITTDYESSIPLPPAPPSL